ncbi:MAG: MFS transporter [archaeon]|nr:MFS transporter [archaeon]
MERPPVFTRNFVLCTVISFFFTVFFFMFYTGMASYSKDILGASTAMAGFTASIFIIGDLISRLYFGGKFDRFGRKRIVVIFLILGTMMSLLYFVADSVAEVCAVRFVHGLTYGAMASAVNTIVAESLPASRRGEGMGYFMLSLSIGSALGPFICMYLQGSGDYNDIFTIGVIASLGALVTSLFIKDAGRPVVDAGREHVSGSQYYERSALPICLVTFVFFFSYSGVLSFIAPYGAEIGLYDYATFFFVTLSVGTLICRLFLGRIYDVRGENWALIPMFILYILGMVLIGTTGNGIVLLLGGMMIGFNIAQLNSVGQAVVVRDAGPERVGVAVSMFCIFMDMAYAIGAIVNGGIIDLLGYRGNYLLMAGLGLLSLVMYVVLHGISHRGRTV